MGLEPRWLLNRLKTEIVLSDAKQSKILPCQVQRKVEDKERAVAVETGKAKEESLKAAGARCWSRILLRCLQKTGEPYIFAFSWEVILVAGLGIWCKPKCNFSPSETWILPIVTLLVIVAYAVLAIVFYNTDG